MMFRVSYSPLMMEAVRTSETSVDNHFTRQYNPEDSSEHIDKLFTLIMHYWSVEVPPIADHLNTTNFHT
jgi:hypothetical protein